MDLTRRALCSGLAGLAVALPSLRASGGPQPTLGGRPVGSYLPFELAADELFWSEVGQAFDLDRTVVNLNNGAVSSTPRPVLEAMIRGLRFSNEAPVFHMWDILEPRIESVRRELAREFGCDPEEIAITRSASEALETLIFGIDLKAGDEVVITDQNHPRMIQSWEQRARRQGIVVKKISFPVPLLKAADLVARFAAALTARTRILDFSQITHLTGQILPVKEVMSLARERGIEVFVDGAHAFGHYPFKRDDLDCDYYGASLHKWLLAPVGTGFLYIRKDRIKKIWPLMSAAPGLDADIRKFEDIGTHPVAIHNAIAEALTFHRGLGGERKAARLRYLRDRWAKRLLQADARVKVLTQLNDTDACAIALLHIDDIAHDKLQTYLLQKHRILTSLVARHDFNGLRITPNIYTSANEIDLFCEKIENVLTHGM